MECTFDREDESERTYNKYERVSKSIETNGKGMKRSGLCGLGWGEMED